MKIESQTIGWDCNEGHLCNECECNNRILKERQEIFNHKSKFLDIRHCEENIVIYNKKGEELGNIYYEPAWKKWVFEIQGFIFDFDCLLAITSELFKLEKENEKTN